MSASAATDQFTRARRLLNTLETYTSAELTPSARLTAFIIWLNGNSSDGNFTFTGRDRIAFGLGLNERATTNALNQLRGLGLIEEIEPASRNHNWRRRIVDGALHERAIWTPRKDRPLVVDENGDERPLTDDELRARNRVQPAAPEELGVRATDGGAAPDRVQSGAPDRVQSGAPDRVQSGALLTTSDEPRLEPLRSSLVLPARGEGKGQGDLADDLLARLFSRGSSSAAFDAESDAEVIS